MNNMNFNPLLSCLEAVFVLMDELQQNMNNERYDTQQLRDAVIGALHQFERLAMEQLIDSDQIYKTKYALTACIDEWVIRSASGRLSSWLSYPLQLELFGDSHAGEQFFNHLSALRLQGEKYIDVLEIYYLCLDCSYEGHYRLSDKSALTSLKCELLNQIQQLRKFKDLKLSDEKAGAQTPSSAVESSMLWLKRAAIAAAIAVSLVSLLLWGTISIKANAYRQDIEKNQHHLMAQYQL